MAEFRTKLKGNTSHYKKDGERMANTKNLIPQAHALTVEELSKGGVNSAISRRNRKRLREELEILLEIGDTQRSVAAALINKAINGDVRAFEVIRDTIGEKPVERVEEQKKIVDLSGFTTEEIKAILDEEI